MEKQGSGIPTDCCVGVGCVCLGEWDAEFSSHTAPPSLTLWLHRDPHPYDPGNTLESPSPIETSIPVTQGTHSNLLPTESPVVFLL